MRITLTQAQGGLAIGATAVLHVDLGAAVPPMDAAPLVAVAAGAWTKVALGPGLEIKSGVLDLAGGGSGYVLPAATAGTRGGVTVGANITLAGDTISLTGANVQAALGFTPADNAGLAKAAFSGAYADLSGTPAPYTLPAATGATLGGVIVGSNLTVAAGTISLTKSNAIAALGLTPVDAAAAAAAAPVQSVGGATGVVPLPYGATVDFSQGAVPVTGTITIDGALAGATTINDAVHAIGGAGGSMTWRLQIVSGGAPTNITGLASVTTDKSAMTTTAATAANKGAAGDRLELVITSVTGTPAGGSITIRGTRP